MAAHIPDDLQQEIARLTASGNCQSEADVLRAAIAALSAQDADFEAISEGLEELGQEKTRPLSAIAAEIRSKHSWSDGD